MPPNTPKATTTAAIPTIVSVRRDLDWEAAPKNVPGAIVASFIPLVAVPLELPLPPDPAIVPLAAAVDVAKPPEILEELW